MNKKVINFHTHLGDLLTQKNITFNPHTEWPTAYDPFMNHAKDGFEGPLIGDDIEEFYKLVDISFERCYANTLVHMQEEMDRNNITYTCIYPIFPSSTFEEMLAASKFDSRLIPFTSADWSLATGKEVGEKLIADAKAGAKGWKMHPILQNISLDDPKVHEALRIWEATGLPVVSHCGVNAYFYGEGAEEKNTPEFGDVKYFIELVKKFPNINFVAAHAGGLCGGEMEYLAENTTELKNLYVDTTFRSVADTKKMVELFGEDKVMFGTDTPFAIVDPCLEIMEKALGDKPEILNKVLYKNALEIMGL